MCGQTGSVKQILDNNLCSMCGACLAVCPKNAIGIQESQDNKYAVVVNGAKCVECGLCEKVCPVAELDLTKSVELYQSEKNKQWDAYIAAAKDGTAVKDAVSGGFVSAFLRYVLSNNLFDSVVAVMGYDCRRPVYADVVEKLDGLQNYTKSRYIPILHTKVFEYILKNRDRRLVFVGVPCAVKAFLNIIKVYKLDRENYFIIGLFCDRNFTYKINDYFSSHLANSREIKQTYFRTKKYSGYPGNGLLILEDGTEIKFLGQERTKIKDYFQMECCLYCVDKFAVESDISVGDNYTKQFVTEYRLGENSLIVRTEKGREILKKLSDELIVQAVSAKAVKESQHMNTRIQNVEFLALKKGSACGITKATKREYKEKIKRIEIGRRYSMKSSSVKMDLQRRELHRKMLKLLNMIFKWKT